MEFLRYLGVIAVFTTASLVASATDLGQPSPLTDAEWDTIQEHVGLLNKISFMPSLLPVIMKHRDALELSDNQMRAFRAWRKENYSRMANVMNRIIEQRIALAKGALDPQIGEAELLNAQKTILKLQRELMMIRLSCRELVVTTFSSDQWNSLAFVLEDYPEFAGLIQ